MNGGGNVLSGSRRCRSYPEDVEAQAEFWLPPDFVVIRMPGGFCSGVY